MKKLLVFFISVVLFSACTGGCSEKETKGTSIGKIGKAENTAYGNKILSGDGNNAFPIVNDRITLRMCRLSFTDIRPPAAELWMWKRYEEMTNIHVEWEEIPRESYTERKNIIMATNDLPDCFYQMPFTNEEIAKYASEGIFIPLNELIDKTAPNFKRLMEEDESVGKMQTMPDGKVYSLPWIQPDVLSRSIRYYINQKWLVRLDLKVPETIDELTGVLAEFKNEDANGNGDTEDEYPIYNPHDSIVSLERQLLGSFGLGNRGGLGISSWIDEGPDGNVRFIPFSPQYKEVWELLHEWWKKGLFHPETLTGVDYPKWIADAANDRVGFFSWQVPVYIGNGKKDDFTGISALKGPQGDAVLSWVEPATRAIWPFIITNKNKHTVETIKWVDYFYSHEGSVFGSMGEEGVTFSYDAESKPKYIDEIYKYKDGVQNGAAQYLEMVIGGFCPYIDLDEETKMALWKTSIKDYYKIEPNDCNKYLPEEIWGLFLPAANEANELTTLLTDINNYIAEMRVKFILGEKSFDTDWEEFISTLNKIGAKKYLEIKEEQFKRYNAKH